MRFASMLAAAVCLAAMSPRSLAQGELYQWPPNAGSWPRAVASTGDLDGDGAPDWAVGETGTTSNAASLRAFISSNGSELWSVPVVAAHDWGVAIIGMDDADQDGRGDLAVGGAGEVRALSGPQGGLLWQLSIPGNVYALARLNDVDLDGVDDLALGAVSITAGVLGRAYVVSGRTGGVLQTVSAPFGATAAFGRGVASLGDFDGDGFHDFAVGDPTARSGAGVVHAVSGDDGRFLASWPGPATSYMYGDNGFGAAIAALGDLDGDAVTEIAVGSPTECLGAAGYEGCLSGVVRLYSGATGALLLECPGSNYVIGPLSFGRAVEAFEDLDADGRADLLIGESSDKWGCCHYGPGDVFVVSSATGQLLLHAFDQTSGILDVVPDVDGDGLDDYLTANGLFGPNSYHSAVALTRHRPTTVMPACTLKSSSEGCSPLIDFDGAPSLTIGPELSLRATRLPAGTLGLFAWSLTAASTPFGGATLCIGGAVHRGPALSSGGSVGVACSGSIELAFPKPFLASIAPAGSTFFAQAWFRDPGFQPPADIGLTQSLAVTIWP